MLQTARIPLCEFRGGAARRTSRRCASPSTAPRPAPCWWPTSAPPASSGPGPALAGDDDGDLDPVPEVVVGAEPEPEPVLLADGRPPLRRPRGWWSGNTIRRIGPTAAAGVIEGIGSDWVDVELESPVPFTEQNELLLLQIGAAEVVVSRHPETSSDQRLVFTLSPQQAASLQDGDEVTVRYGGGHSPLVWSFGPLDTSLLPP